MAITTIYLDHAATTPLLAQAAQAMNQGLLLWANPSSPHGAGRRARAMLEDARLRIKAALGWEGEVIFTSGASEALAIAITRSKNKLTAVSAGEHQSVMRHCGEARILPIDVCGMINPEHCSLGGLVAVQQVNNETGVIQLMDEIYTAVRSAGGFLLADCAQGAGKLDLPGADLIAISAHKFGGLVGTGALLVKDLAMLNPVGGQEHGYRPGTENMPGIMAMAAALEADLLWLDHAAKLRVKLDQAITEMGGEVIAAGVKRIPTIGSYRMPGLSALAQLIRFDSLGFAVSAGSACSSGVLKTSHVLKAMGTAGADEVIRVSIGRETDAEDVKKFITAWQEIAE